MMFPQKLNYNFDKPFLYIIKKLTNDNNAHFVEAPALHPPEQGEVTKDQIDTWNKELEEANKVAIGGDGDDEDL